MKRFDPTSAYDCMVMRKRIEQGWEPTPGTYWSVLSYRTDSERVVHYPPVRTASAQEALERTVAQFTPPRRGILITVVADVVTEEDVLTWKEDRDRWLLSLGEFGS